MRTPLIPEEGDPKWYFVRNVLRIFEKRKMRKIVSKHGVKPLSEVITMLKVVILAMCFETDITFIISELKAKASLRDICSTADIPELGEIAKGGKIK